MFQNNLLLAQLKQQLHSQTTRVEGIVKGTKNGFGFLEVDTQKRYFIPPLAMKKVMHGDKITALIYTKQCREIAEPYALIEPFLRRFIGQVRVKDNRITMIPGHPLIKDVIPTRQLRHVTYSFNDGDWVIAEMRGHPLKGDRQFYAEITTRVATSDDQFAPWWVTLARYNLAPEEPKILEELKQQDGDLLRKDLTALDFITIDNASTEDMDDATYVEPGISGSIILTIAIADPAAWVLTGSMLDIIARDRAFTNYLPGLNIPMLPRILSDNLCALRPHELRPALVCRVTVAKDGTLAEDAHFMTALIKSKSKLTYDNVSDWLENNGKWQPESDTVAEQIRLLQQVYYARNTWRQHNALVFKDRKDYRFVLDNKGNVLKIIAEQRRIANHMIEEAMIAANICAARMLRNKLGFGLYNVHYGFDTNLVNQAVNLLKNHGITADPAKLLTLEGFCNLRRQLNTLPTSYLDIRLRRFQTYTKMSINPGPHFGMGLDIYATWTSPIRKYGDMLNLRLLKALIGSGEIVRPSEEIQLHLTDRYRQKRMAERDISDWLYARFLKNQVDDKTQYSAEIIDIHRSGMRVRLLENGAWAFIPVPYIHSVRDELVCSQETGIVQVKGEERFRQGKIIKVIITEVRMETHSIIVQPV